MTTNERATYLCEILLDCLKELDECKDYERLYEQAIEDKEVLLAKAEINNTEKFVADLKNRISVAIEVYESTGILQKADALKGVLQIISDMRGERK